MPKHSQLSQPADAAVAAYGRGIAAVITASFGYGWLCWGFSAIPHLPVATWAALSFAANALILWAIAGLLRGRKMMKAQGTSRAGFWRKRRTPFVIVTLLEIAGCILVAVLATSFHHPGWIAAGISLVVGLHFLPLGRIFARLYYWVGGLIVLCAALSLTSAGSWNRTASACIATGSVLCATAICILIRSSRVHAPVASPLQPTGH